MSALLALLAASMDALIELPACFCLSILLARRERRDPLDVSDLVCALIVVGVFALLVHRALRATHRDYAGWGRIYRLPPGSKAPTVSWAHFVWSAAWMTLGLGVWEVWGGCALVAGALSSFRAIVWVRRWRD